MEKKRFFLVSLFALLIMLLVHPVAFGESPECLQDGGRFDRDEFIAKRNAFITEKVGLTTEEITVFIPLDNELLNKKFEIGRECRSIERELLDKKEKSEAECNKLLKCREEVKEKRDRMDKEYLEKFKKILSAEKILKYQSADRDFFEDYFRDRKR